MSADFRRVAIVGRGLIGGSIELALAARAPSIEVVALDRGQNVAAIRGADLVVLSAPILEIIGLLSQIRPHLTAYTLVTDTGSTKRAIVDAAAGLRFIGGHPISGAATSGLASARADLFVGGRWILTPGRGQSGADLSRLTGFIEGFGASVQVLDADEHDRLFALVSHLPQLVVSALMHVAGTRAGEHGLALAGPGLRDSTRLAPSPPDIWRDIVQSNAANIEEALDVMIGSLAALKRGGELEAIFESAARWKRILDDTPPRSA